MVAQGDHRCLRAVVKRKVGRFGRRESQGITVGARFLVNAVPNMQTHIGVPSFRRFRALGRQPVAQVARKMAAVMIAAHHEDRGLQGRDALQKRGILGMAAAIHIVAAGHEKVRRRPRAYAGFEKRRDVERLTANVQIANVKEANES